MRTSTVLVLLCMVLCMATCAAGQGEFWHTPPANLGAANAGSTTGIRIQSYTGSLLEIGFRTNVGNNLRYRVVRSTSATGPWTTVYDFTAGSAGVSGGWSSHVLPSSYYMTSGYTYGIVVSWTSGTRDYYYADGAVPYTNGATTIGGLSSSALNSLSRIYGVRVKLRTCSPLGQPANGVRVHGQPTTFSCNNGYSLSGSSSRTCQSNGQWSGSTTSCPLNPTYCSALAKPTNGNRSPSPCPRTLSSTCSFSCNNGYSRSGSATRTCNNNGASGSWSGSTTSCNLITNYCPALSAPSNGVTTGAPCARSIGALCGTTSCNTGYDLVGSASRSCGSGASWSGSAWSCSLDTTFCPPVPSAPANGYHTSACTARSYTASCGFACDLGYNLVGSPSTTCTSGGSWSSGSPTCPIIADYCAPYPVPADGTRSAACTNTVGSTCGTTACNAGYTLVGSALRTCTAAGPSAGTWTGAEPFCSSTSPPDSTLVASDETLVAGTPWSFTVVPRDTGGLVVTAGVDVVDVYPAGAFGGEGLSTTNSTWINPVHYAVHYDPPTTAGVYALDVWLNAYLLGTLTITVVPATLSAPHSDAFGGGISGSVPDGSLFLPGRTATFTVVPRDAFGNAVGTAGVPLPAALLRDESGDPWPVAAAVFDADVFELTYTVPASGRWTLSVTIDLVPVGASPWLVTVSIECFPGTSAFSEIGPCLACPVNTYTDEISLRECKACPEATTGPVGAGAATNCTCVPGTYSPGGVPGVACTQCPEGAACVGGVAGPRAQAGFFGVEGSTDSFVKCPNPAACAGDGQCTAGYSGRLCAECARGYYKLGSECRPCQTGLTVVVVVLLLVLSFAGCAALVYLNTRVDGTSLYGAAGAMIGLSALQIIALVGTVDVAWSATARTILDIISFANLNVDLTSPECSMTLDNPWLFRFILTLCLPVIGAAILGIVCAIGILLVSRAGPKAHVGASGVVYAAARSYFQVLNVVYLPLVSTTLGVFDCIRVGTRSVMSNAPSQECYTPFYWSVVFPLGLVFGVVYGIGIPACVGASLFRAQRAMDDVMFHIKYAFLVARFRPGMRFFELGVMGRKFAVVLALIAFGNAVHEALLVVLVLAVAALHVARVAPYVRRSHTDLDALVTATTMAVLLGALTTRGSLLGELAMSGGLVIIIVAITASVVYDVASMRSRRGDDMVDVISAAGWTADQTDEPATIEMMSFGSTNLTVVGDEPGDCPSQHPELHDSAFASTMGDSVDTIPYDPVYDSARFDTAQFGDE